MQYIIQFAGGPHNGSYLNDNGSPAERENAYVFETEQEALEIADHFKDRAAHAFHAVLSVVPII